MASWAVRNAKARFSELLETCLAEGPQIVTKRGVGTAVLVSIAEWRRLQRATRPGLRSLLLAHHPRTNRLVPPRGKLCRRSPTGHGARLIACTCSTPT